MDRSTWTLIYGVFLYLIWGVTLLFSKNSMGATVMGVFQRNGINHTVAGILFLVVGSMTLAGLILKKKQSMLSLFLCFPQQFCLMLNTLPCITAMIYGQYADLEKRPFGFIFIDQFPFILFALIHTIVLIDLCLFPSYNDR